MSIAVLLARVRMFPSLMLVLILAGCASTSHPTSPTVKDGPPVQAPVELSAVPDPEPRIEPIRRGGPNKSYSVLGRSYEPMDADAPLKQRGLASWYGQKFQGRPTASGELFSMYGVTAAHRTLPIPSYARVRNVSNGKEIIVRVNDRGPFHSARVMDLSYAAALKLGMVAKGSAEVEIERLTFDDIRTGAWRKRNDPAMAMSSPADDPILTFAASSSETAAMPPADEAASGPSVDVATEAAARAYTPAAQGYWVQLAALNQRTGVEKLQQRVNAQLASLAPLVAVFKEASLYRLQVGPYRSLPEARSVARSVRRALALNPMVIERR